MQALKLLAAGLITFCALPSMADVLVGENFEARSPGTPIANFGPGWMSTTRFFVADDQPGLAADGSGYLAAPSLFGAGDRQRFAWFDASSGFNARGAGSDLVVATVKMFIPDVSSSTYGGMVMFDQSGNPVAVIGVDMLAARTLTDATAGVNNVGVLLDQYNDIELRANFQSGEIDYLFNGSTIGSTLMGASSLGAGFGDFDFYNNGFNATFSVAFRYDDYLVRTVPEPSGLVLFGVGLAALFALRRQSRR